MTIEIGTTAICALTEDGSIVHKERDAFLVEGLLTVHRTNDKENEFRKSGWAVSTNGGMMLGQPFECPIEATAAALKYAGLAKVELEKTSHLSGPEAAVGTVNILGAAVFGTLKHKATRAGLRI